MTWTLGWHGVSGFGVKGLGIRVLGLVALNPEPSTVKVSEFSGLVGFRDDVEGAAEAAELDLRVQQILGNSIILSVFLLRNSQNRSRLGGTPTL